MGRPDLTALLDRCVIDVKAGRKTLDECLAEHAAERAHLEPLLRLALAIVTPAVEPNPARKARARYELVAALHEEPRRAWSVWAAMPFPLARRLSVSAAGLLIVGALVATSGGAAFAAQDAQPGDLLYGVKTAIEQVQVVTAPSDEAKARVYLDLAAKRLVEVERALDRDNAAAAEAAAEAHARALANAETLLTQAEREGRPLGAVLERLEANLERQAATLEKAAERAAPAAQAPIERARERAQRGLQLAKERAHERGGGPALAPAAAGAATPTARVPLAASPGERPERGESPAADQARAVAPLSPDRPAGAAARRLEQLRVQVSALAGEPTSRGERARGLAERLDAVRDALERDQRRPALNQLDAFTRQLDATHRAGDLSDERHAALRASVATLAAALGDQLEDDEDDERERGTRGRTDHEPSGGPVQREQDEQQTRPTLGPREPARPAPATPRSGRSSDDERQRDEADRDERAGTPPGRARATATPSPAARVRDDRPAERDDRPPGQERERDRSGEERDEPSRERPPGGAQRTATPAPTPERTPTPPRERPERESREPPGPPEREREPDEPPGRSERDAGPPLRGPGDGDGSDPNRPGADGPDGRRDRDRGAERPGERSGSDQPGERDENDRPGQGRGRP